MWSPSPTFPPIRTRYALFLNPILNSQKSFLWSHSQDAPRGLIAILRKRIDCYKNRWYLPGIEISPNLICVEVRWITLLESMTRMEGEKGRGCEAVPRDDHLSCHHSWKWERGNWYKRFTNARDTRTSLFQGCLS